MLTDERNHTKEDLNDFTVDQLIRIVELLLNIQRDREMMLTRLLKLHNAM